MKNKLLASSAITALTAFGSAAAAEITISGTARVGLMTTEGAAAVVGDTVYSASAGDAAFMEIVSSLSVYMTLDATGSAVAGITSADSTATAPTAGNVAAMRALRANIAAKVENAITSVLRSDAAVDLASVDAILARIDATVKTAVAAKSDTTTAENRVRISFAGSGETDGGLTYGFSARADQSNSSNGGSQYISGAFGKVSMGDLDGADEQMAGNLAGVGFTGAGSHQNFAYQSASHNLSYSISMAGVSFAASTDLVRGADSTKTGSNSAMGIKWSGDVGGATVGIGLGQSKVGTSSEDSISASVSMGGLTIKAVSHSNDNGPAVASTVASLSSATGTAHTAAVADVNNYDTDTTGLSISYAMDSLTVTAFTRTEETQGVADKDYSGVGFAYNMGGATLKAGFVDNNNISVMDFGLNFSF
jgi:outer membrane protein OmpU